MALDPRYAQYAEQLSQQMGVDPAITRHVLALETNGDPHAVSHAGARGLMQLMPATGAALGLNGADFFDPYKNIHAGVANLAQLSKQFGGDPTSILIGYNAGPRWANDLRSGKIQFGQLPHETQSYVQRFGNGAIPQAMTASAAPMAAAFGQFAPLPQTGAGPNAERTAFPVSVPASRPAFSGGYSGAEPAAPPPDIGPFAGRNVDPIPAGLFDPRFV